MKFCLLYTEDTFMQNYNISHKSSLKLATIFKRIDSFNYF